MGFFGLIEFDFGSNFVGMVINFKDKGDYYLLNGVKFWIFNLFFCDVVVVWVKDENGCIYGFVVERGMEGFIILEIYNKWFL